mmetsp:Transcript_7222/g.17945  ORF Transcript_7222/g.17945 Transcript_7222/m.17945 type:complete len:1179 (+) Transcript_7222:174-3710(+)
MARFDWREVVVALLASIGIALWYQERLHWTVAALASAPMLLGVLPKLRITFFMSEKRSSAPPVQGKGPSFLIKKSTSTLMALVIPPVRLKRKPKKSGSMGNFGKHLHSGSEPNSPAFEPVSPKSMGLRVMERLHFNGNKYEFFAGTKFAGCLREDECDELFKLVQWREFEEGETIFRAGDSIDDGLYMVVTGQLEVFSGEEDLDEDEMPKYHMLQGESIGDMDLVSLSSINRRKVSVRASKSSLVMQLTQEAWGRFCCQNPHALLLFLRLAIGRLYRVAFFVLADFMPLPIFAIPAPDVTELSGLLEDVAEVCRCKHIMNSYSETVPKGTILVHANSVATSFYVLLEGSLTTVEAPPEPSPTSSKSGKGRAGSPIKTVMECKGVSIIGARSFFVAHNHYQDVIATEDSKVVCFTLENLLEFGQEHPEDFLLFVKAATQVLYPVIAKFVGLGLSRHWIKAGEDLFHAGQDADGVYVLITGRAKLRQPGSREIVAEIGRGDTMGEEAVLDLGKVGATAKRMFDARCMRDCELVKISPRNFDHICNRYPQVSIKFIRTIARRNIAWQGIPGSMTTERGQRTAGQSKTANLATIAIIPLNPESEAQAQKFAKLLKLDLRKFGSASVLNEERVCSLLGPETMDNLHTFFYRTRVASWINQQEEEHRFIILLGDAKASAWSQIVVSQADIILAVSHHDALPSVCREEMQVLWDGQPANERAALWGESRKELILLHDDSLRLPKLTKLWLDQRPGLSLHHHVRMDTKKDFARLGRHLAGRAVGVVLGGGGARGLAHLGVLRAMEELGLPIDFIGGTSQGAFMGCLYAQTLHTSKMDRGVEELSNGIGSVLALMRDLTLPILSIFSGKSFSATIRKCLGTLDIRDTWINFFCISCSVSSPYQAGTIRVHRKGQAWKYVRASMTVVGYLPPVYDDGELLVDGGYVNNLPSDEMQKLGVHTVIGVDVEDKDESMYADVTPLKDHVSGWWVLGMRMLEMIGLGGDFKIPRQSDILSTLCYVSHTNQLPRAKACLDLYLRPPVEGYKLLDYHKKDEIVEKAYKYALKVLRDFLMEQNMEGLDIGPSWTGTRSAVMPMLGTDRESKHKWAAPSETPENSQPPTPRNFLPLQPASSIDEKESWKDVRTVESLRGTSMARLNMRNRKKRSVTYDNIATFAKDYSAPERLGVPV